MIRWGKRKKDNQSYVKKQKKILTGVIGSTTPSVGKIHQATIPKPKFQQPTSELKTSMGTTTSISLKHILPEYREFIKKNYPHGRWEYNGTYYYVSPASEGRTRNFLETISVREHDKWNKDKKDDPIWGNVPSDLNASYVKKYPNQKKLDEWYYAMQRDPMNKELQNAFLEIMAESIVEDEKKDTNFYVDYRPIKVNDGFGIERLVPPIQQFVRDVEQGKHQDENGLTLSVHQVQGLKPYGGFLNDMTGILFKKDSEMERRKKLNEVQRSNGYYSGLVIKIDSSDQKIKDWNNSYVIITKIIDDYHYKVVPENGDQNDSFIVRDTDVKGVIGDLSNDFIGIGEERHTNEIVPIIKKAMGYPVVVGKIIKK